MPGHQASGYCRAGTSPKCASGDTAKLPHGSGPKEIDAIEQHHVEVGTTETVAHCALGTPLNRVHDAQHRLVYLYANGLRITVDNGYVVATTQAQKP